MLTFQMASFLIERNKAKREEYGKKIDEIGEMVKATDRDIRSTCCHARMVALMEDRRKNRLACAWLRLKMALSTVSLDILIRGSQMMSIFGLGVLMMVDGTMTMLEYTYISRYMLFTTFNIDTIARIYSNLVAEDTTIQSKLHELESHECCVAAESIDPSEITIEELAYQYDTGDYKMCLTEPLKLRAGEVIAVTGPSGAGKTTFSSLFTGNMNLAGLRCKIKTRKGVHYDAAACVSLREVTQFFDQESREFIPKDRVNMRKWIGSTSDSAVIELARELRMQDKVRLDEDIPNSLSPGEKIRLALIRMMLKVTSPIVVLDEAEGGLEDEDAARVVGAIRSHFYDKLVIMVSHHKPSIAAADHQIWIEDGTITIVR